MRGGAPGLVYNKAVTWSDRSMLQNLPFSDFIHANENLLLLLGAVSIVTFFGSLLVVPWITSPWRNAASPTGATATPPYAGRG